MDTTVGKPVLHVLSSMRQRDGGPVRAVLDLSARALLAGYPSEVLSVGEYEVQDSDYPRSLVHMVPSASWEFGYRYSAELGKWCDSGSLSKYAAVVLHGMWLYPLWRVAKGCREQDVPYACFPHGMLDEWPVKGQGWLKRAKKTAYWLLRESEIFRHAACVCFTARRELERSENVFPIFGVKRILVPYGVDICKVPAERVLLPRNPELLSLKDCKYLLFLGRVHPKKNAHLLIRSWAAAKSPAGWRLVIAGAGDEDYLNELKRLRSELRLEESIDFVGHVEGADKAFLFSNASWFALPSKQENFGIAVLEAMTYGCPVAISTEVYLTDRLHRLSEVLPLDVEAWAGFIRNRMVDHSLREQVIALDREQVLPQFEINEVAAQWGRTFAGISGISD